MSSLSADVRVHQPLLVLLTLSMPDALIRIPHKGIELNQYPSLFQVLTKLFRASGPAVALEADAQWSPSGSLLPVELQLRGGIKL